MHRSLVLLIAIGCVVVSGCGRADGIDASKFNPADWEKQLKKPGLSEVEFTRLYALKIAADFKGADVRITGPREITTKLPDGQELKSFLDNVWAEAAKDPEHRPEIVNHYLAALKVAAPRKREKGPPDTNRIVAVIRDQRFAANFNKLSDEPGKHMVTEPLVADLLIFYAIDGEGSIQYLTETNRSELKLSLPALRKLALTNLRRILPEIKRYNASPMFKLAVDGNYDSSLLLLEDVWEEEAKVVQGELVAVVPSRDMLIYTGTKMPNGIQKLRDTAKKTEKGGSHLITDTLIVRRNGRWERFSE